MFGSHIRLLGKTRKLVGKCLGKAILGGKGVDVKMVKLRPLYKRIREDPFKEIEMVIEVNE